MTRFSSLLGVLALACLTASTVEAQSNVIPGTDISLGAVGSIAHMGRIGTYPNGTTALSLSTTSCNVGSVVIPFNAPMAPTHPFISFLVTREDSQRMIQIHDRAWVKHAFAATCGSTCGSCACGGGGLGLGCSDTYGSGLNGSRFYLGPPSEIDPYLGTWTALGSFFDGTPVDGVRSYQGSEPNEVNHRIEIPDSELGLAGNEYHYQAMYTTRGEEEGARANNLGYRTFTSTWNGSTFSISSVTGSLIQGSVLNGWAGASLSLANNGFDDGRIHVAWKATFASGMWHYEYALHNQDNNRGIGRFEIPCDPAATVTNFGFHDVDQNAANQWTATKVGSTIVFETTSNPLRWNSIFNFWFDASAAPAASNAQLTQFDAGPGLNVLAAAIEAPLGDAVTTFCIGDGGVAPGCTDCPCGNNAMPGSLGGCVNSNGSSAQLLQMGTASVMADTLRFDLFLGNVGTFGVLISADNRLPQMGACPVGSGVQSGVLDGLRCVGGNVIRHGSRATDGAGNSVTPWGPPGGPAGGLIAANGFVSGQTRYFQCFYRESLGMQCGTGQNTTNGSRVQFAP